MKICIIANVGQRDLMIDGKPLPSEKLREYSKEINENYESQKGRLSAPLLEPAMNLILNEFDNKTEIKMTLIATNQEDLNFQKGDTIYCAKVLEKLLKAKFSKKTSLDIRIRELKSPPNMYDAMIPCYMGWAQSRKFQTENADRVYLICTGGTPACNTALLLAGISVFRHKCEAIYINERDKNPYPLQVGKQVLGLYRKERLNALLKRHDFAGIAADTEQAQEVRDVAGAAAARLNFDFEKMKRHLAPLVREPFLRSLIGSLWDEANTLTKNDCERVKKLRELYWNAVLKWEAEECADFLGRVFRLREEALRVGVERVSGIALDSTQANDKKLWDWVREDPELEQKMGNKSGSHPSTEVLSKVLEIESAKFPEVRGLYETSEWFRDLSQLRNKSIIAHDTQGVSKENILEKITGTEETIFDQLKRLCELLGVETGENPYDEFAKAIHQIDEKVNR
ncbi:MAG TPA: hypothetical protein PKY35_04730 [Candidatus Hydrogenedentes bacterium]|nr:hypothetical protein [Candidatus Hydrogenedentota bacterium]HOL76314.1 hypothetical protein [Candidatus Hydrogenedentota bacterium]HPO86142.1 hypothetical protein [Candidatus Hydrogenedentota bacterium]